MRNCLCSLGVVVLAVTSTSLAADRDPNREIGQSREAGTSIQSLSGQCMSKDLGERSFCVGYVSGLADSMSVLALAESTRRAAICTNRPLNYESAVQGFAKWARKHPELASADRRLGVAWALKEMWPCT